MELDGDRILHNGTGIVAAGPNQTFGQAYFANCVISNNNTAYLVQAPFTLTGTNPGTNLIRPGQFMGGTITAPTAQEFF
jgi:hypothetical protein